MYSTCLFCRAPLGANDAVEQFPMGRRLAFDAEKGRLWVVCRSCARWNLTPLEERWEAIEQCERLFRETKTRASTDEIGLARVGDGLELVRIGRPLRPEFAAWRYGDQFGLRRGRAIVRGAASTLLGASILLQLPFAVGVGALAVWWGMELAVRSPPETGGKRAGDALAHPQGGVLHLGPGQRGRARLVELRPGDWGLRVEYRTRESHPDLPLMLLAGRDGREAGEVTFAGPSALHALGVLMARINESGAARARVLGAVRRIEEAGGPGPLVAQVGRQARARAVAERWEGAAAIGGLPLDVRLALEMSAHEESERRALDGELAALEGAWRDAERIAAIADGLLLPPRVSEAIDRLKAR